MKKVRYILYVALLAGFFSCETYLDPREDNRLTEEQMVSNPILFEGILLNVYDGLPSEYNFREDVLSDDAVTNDKSSPYQRMATGEWTSIFYPNSQWEQAYEAIYYLNYFLSRHQEVEWAWRSDLENMWHMERVKGEAHALRAFWEFRLLQYHAGPSPSGGLLGYPIVREVIDSNDEYRLPRNTYAECIDHIMADLDTAVKYLPEEYRNIGVNDPNSTAYNSAWGTRLRHRIQGTIARALRTRIMLHAASPAFDYLSWSEVADSAGALLAENGGLSALPANGLLFYTDTRSREVIWRNSISRSNNMELANFPPSEYGNGRTNPTQDLVDVFPMKNGYPVDHPSSGYEPDDPYNNRDPRLGEYIIYNGNVLKDSVFTHVGDDDGINQLETSTRSGYYVKKFMMNGVNLEPGNVSSADHFFTYIRFTEVFLNYAEAANEAWGPDGDPRGYGITARSVIAAIRERAGIEQPDEYLQSVSGKDEMRELIRAERRIELCFEGHRFWDLRRWNLADQMAEDVHAMRIDFTSTPSHTTEFLEQRDYQEHMIYGPLPYEELLKYDIVQNAGW